MIIGHLFQRQYLEKAAKMRKIPHAFLFSGPEKIGKKKIALEFAKTLIGFENSFDLALVEPEEGLIQISKIRDLRSWFYLSSQSFKVVIIDNAHCMNSEAQSSLLKTLEEPRGKVVFILITSFPKILLPTIISRVEVLNFYKTPDSEIKKYVQNQGIDQSVAAKITVLSKGKAGLALDFLSDTEKLRKYEQDLQEIALLSYSSLALRFSWAGKTSKKELKDIIADLDICLNYFRDIFLSKIKGMDISYSFPKLKKILSLIQKTIFLISTTNVNKKVALEVLAIELN